MTSSAKNDEEEGAYDCDELFAAVESVATLKADAALKMSVARDDMLVAAENLSEAVYLVDEVHSRLSDAIVSQSMLSINDLKKVDRELEFISGILYSEVDRLRTSAVK